MSERRRRIEDSFKEILIHAPGPLEADDETLLFASE